MWSRRRRRSSTGCRCCERRTVTAKRATTEGRFVMASCLCVFVVNLFCRQRPRRGACRLAEPVHRSDAGPAGTREDRRAVAARPRSRPLVRRTAGRPPADRARLGRGGAAPASGPDPRRTVRRADHARAAAAGAHPGAAHRLAAGLRRHPRRPPVCSRPRSACRSGARRCSPRWTPGSPRCRIRTTRSAPWSGNRAASPRGRAR